MEKVMEADAAWRWCKDNGMEILPYQYPDHAMFSGLDKNDKPLHITKRGESGVNVSGWYVPSTRTLEKTRINEYAPTMTEAANNARRVYEAARDAEVASRKESGSPKVGLQA